MHTFFTRITACMTIISTGGYHKLKFGTYLPKAVRLSLQLFSTIEQLVLTDYIPADEEF